MAADIAAKYPDAKSNPASPARRVFDSVALVTVLDAAPIAITKHNEYWAGTAKIERTLWGQRRTGKVGLAQQFIDSCYAPIEMPKPGQHWVIYFERDAKSPGSNIWMSPYPLDYALSMDPRIREAVSK